MHIRAKALIAAIIVGLSVPPSAVAEEAALTAAARKLVACMRAFDAQCVGDMTYARFFRDFGVTKEQVIKAVTRLNANLRELNVSYTSFDLGQPTKEFKLDGRTFVFLPYVGVMSLPGQGTLTYEAYFIGISEDDGATWAFVEGSEQTTETIKRIIPGYQNQPPTPAVKRTRDENAPDPPVKP